MKRGAGFLALFTFLITGLHFANGPGGVTSSAEDSFKPQNEVTSKDAAPKMAVASDETCDAFADGVTAGNHAGNPGREADQRGQIAALIAQYLYGTQQQAAMSSGTIPEGIRLMIVTVPDPIHTHLNLQFDRTLETVQQAAQDEKYTYDSSWLPWRPASTNNAGGEVELREATRREACPGLILFRRGMSAVKPDNCKASAPDSHLDNAPYLCGMFVFVVAETPTSGVNRMQWDNALNFIDKHASKTRPDKVLRILGPNFSGSVPSFVRALEETRLYVNSFSSALLYSGRIRGCASWRWIKKELNPPESKVETPPRIRLPVRLADFEENDALQSARLFKYLKNRGHLLSEVAILSEDETAYGGLPDSARPASQEGTDPGFSSCNPPYPLNDKPVHLYYPRDISAIRSAYQEQSIFSAGSKTSSTNAPQTVLRAESDPTVHRDTDTIEPFSGTNMALTQEAQLYGIVNTLRTHGIRYVVLRSTNSLDYLFLTRFLHRAYPTAYIVTMGSDLLFAREIDSTEFRGVVSLSTFPLLPRGQDWTKQIESVPQHAHRVFGSYTMEGDYLAVRFLTTDPGVTAEESTPDYTYKHEPKSDIPDYALPFWDSPTGAGDESKAATWLAVIGRDGYWPLAILKDPIEDHSHFSNLAIVKRAPKTESTVAHEKTPKEHLTLSSSWRFCCILALFAFGIHFFACRYGWKRQNFGMFVQFTPLEGNRGPALIAVGWAVICSLLLMLSLASGRIYLWLDTMDRVWVLVICAATVTALLLATLELKWWNEPNAPENDAELRKSKENQRKRLHFSLLWICLMFAIVIFFGITGWLTYDFNEADSSGVTTAYRSVHLTSGVSPIISTIVMLAGFYWWFWQTLSGLTLLGNGRPVLPRRKQIPLGLSQVSDDLAGSIEAAARPFPRLGRHTHLFYAIPLFLVVLLAFVLQRAWMQAFDLVLHSLENTAFNRALHAVIAIALYLLLLESEQFYSTWLALKRLLLALNRLPLRRTFAALQGLSMQSLWKLSGTSSRARYKIFSHQLEALLHLRNELAAFEYRDCGSDNLRQCVNKSWAQGWHFVQERSKGPDLAMINDDEALTIRLQFCACAEEILNELLVPQWLSERTSLDLRATPSDDKTNVHMTLSGNMPVRLAEEFVCMIYVGYLQNLLGCMRSKVLSMIGLFAAIALAVGFYPFTPRPVISLSLVVLLALIGTVVGIVYAGLDRDSTLSYITNTAPGALGAHFWLRIVSFVGVPALGLIVAQFPEITSFVFSWVQPTMNAVK